LIVFLLFSSCAASIVSFHFMRFLIEFVGYHQIVEEIEVFYK